MQVNIYGKGIRSELRLTYELASDCSKSIFRNLNELRNFYVFPYQINVTAKEVFFQSLLIQNTNLVSFKSYGEIEFVEISLKDENIDYTSFFKINRIHPSPLRLKLDFYFNTAQAPAEHLILDENPFLVIYNEYVYFSDISKAFDFIIIKNFVKTQLDNLYNEIVKSFPFFYLKYKYFNEIEILEISAALSRTENILPNYDLEYIHEILNQISNFKFKYKNRFKKIQFKPRGSVVSAIKSLLNLTI